MNRRVFETHLASLQGQIADAVKGYFKERDIPFDEVAFAQNTSCDLDQTAREMLFFGADIFPNEGDGPEGIPIPTPVAHLHKLLAAVAA